METVKYDLWLTPQTRMLYELSYKNKGFQKLLSAIPDSDDFLTFLSDEDKIMDDIGIVIRAYMFFGYMMGGNFDLAGISKWLNSFEGYTMVSTNEDGRVIGNCRQCGADGVLVREHKCDNSKV